ncbi:MAG: hypothetical protein J0L56_03320 [Chitinophagales bacterium]|nr:hypothetical protein [Chitinophagales bacterium]
MKHLFQFLLFSLILSACSPTKQIEKRYTPDDKLVFDLIERLKKNPNDAEAAKQLPEAYEQAAEVRKNINSNTFNNMNEGDRWIEISRQLLVAQQLYSEIKGNTVISKIIPNPWDPTVKIQEAKQKAAEEYYNQGQRYLTYNNRPYARKAYDMFVKANNAYPNYKDVREMMEQSKLLATIKVVVNPVNYDNYGWNYWGFNNDYLQYKIIRDLNNSSYRDVKFYSEDEARRLNIRPDRIVNLAFTDLYIGQLFNDRYSIDRSKQIEVGQTKTNPPQPIYETVKATVYVTRRVLQSRASLECRIYDWASNRNILFDRFPDNNTWKDESARYTGDKRALEQSDRNLINNSSNINPPSRNELAQRLIDNCYNQLLSRIRNGVSFDY